eukprot:m.203080 g.203080  ORF g.203080 m.203080 type:complete len:454 (-) comp17732_c0_seq2:334-1695(-)
MTDVQGEAHALVEQQYRTYKQRWGMLAICSLLQIGNAMMWISFAPIADLTSKWYDVGNIAVDQASLVFMYAFLVAGPLASWLYHHYGLRFPIVLAALINMIGAWGRFAGDFASNPHTRFGLMLIGQSLSALAQPVILDSPTPLAAVWFGENERAFANMLCAVSNPIGVAVASALSPMIVDHPSDMRTMLWIFAIPNTLAFVFAFLFMRDRPPTPPSPSASHGTNDFAKDFKALFTNPQYLLLFFAFGIGVAAINSFTTLTGQIVNAQGYSDDEAGYFGAFMIGCGLVGAVVAGLFVDKTHRFRDCIKVQFIGATASFMMFVLVNKPGNFGLLLTASGLTGFFAFGILPVALELSVECSYPVSEGSSAGYLWLNGQALGIVTTFSMNAFADHAKKNYYPDPEDKTQMKGYADMTDASWFMVACAAVSTLLILGFTSEYRRRIAESSIKLNESQS